MPSAAMQDVQARDNAPDELDKLFEYDEAVEDFLKDLPLDKNGTAANTVTSPRKDIDEEITIKKKRKPIPKLDATLLTSSKGIPKLNKITKSRLRFKGKGHEFSDMTTLLNMYQLWLDDMYPRAKFRDALSMVEKLGHGKRMQVMRRAWLDETKPMAARGESPEREGDMEMSGALPLKNGGDGERGLFSGDDEDIFPSETAAPKEPDNDTNAAHQDGEPGDDELDALLAETEQQPPKVTRPRGPFEEDDDDDEDELDALLAEQTTAQLTKQPISGHDKDDNNLYADDEEAMAGMDMW